LRPYDACCGMVEQDGRALPQARYFCGVRDAAMPSPHFRVSVISRGGGQSAVASAAYTSGGKLTSVVASAAYRSGQTLYDERVGKTFDYTRKEHVVHTEIIAPEGAPEWAFNRQQLWNAVEAGEKRKDARLARSIIAGLPRELDTERNIALVRAFVQEQHVGRGMIADIAIHDKDASDGGRNPHVHILLTLRDITADGFNAKKNREWDKTEMLEEWRDAWENLQNRYLEAAGRGERVSLKSYEEQGIDKIPGQHMGYKANGLERKGEQTKVGKRNRDIQRENEAREAARQHRQATAAIADYQRRMWQEVRKSNEFYRNTLKQYGAMLREHGGQSGEVGRSPGNSWANIQQPRQTVGQAQEITYDPKVWGELTNRIHGALQAARKQREGVATPPHDTRYIWGVREQYTHSRGWGMSTTTRTVYGWTPAPSERMQATPAQQDNHRKLEGFVKDTRMGQSKDNIGTIQRAAQYAKDKLAAYTKALAERTARWADRERQRRQDKTRERNPGYER
jgi:MobA/MobL family